MTICDAALQELLSSILGQYLGLPSAVRQKTLANQALHLSYKFPGHARARYAVELRYKPGRKRGAAEACTAPVEDMKKVPRATF